MGNAHDERKRTENKFALGE